MTILALIIYWVTFFYLLYVIRLNNKPIETRYKTFREMNCIPKEGVGWIEIAISPKDVMKDGERISKGIMENEFYEVTEDFMTGEYIVRMGNPVLPYKELEGDKE